MVETYKHEMDSLNNEEELVQSLNKLLKHS